MVHKDSNQLTKSDAKRMENGEHLEGRAHHPRRNKPSKNKNVELVDPDD